MVETDNYIVQVIQPNGERHGSTISQTCASLFANSELVDCTLSCSDGHLQVHRVVLASASTYMYNMLTSTPLPSPCSHPIIFLRNSTLADVRCAMEYIYTGETQTTKNRLPALLEISQELGSISLRKAVESTIQACGIETFKRRINSSSRKISDEQNENGRDEIPFHHENTNTNNGLSSPFSDETITVKIEADSDNYDENQDQHEDSYENESPETFSLSPISDSSNSVNPTNKRSSGPQSPIETQSTEIAKMPRVSGERGSMSSESRIKCNTTSNKKSSAINIQHEKGESFLYTNEDFEMKSANSDEKEDEENNYESSGETELEPMVEELPEPTRKSVVSLPKPIVSMSDFKDFLKVNLKPEDDNNGVPASCPWCMQVFTNLALLQKHIRTHVNNYRPFTCDYCHNTFARSAHLKRHLRTHTGEKPYQCNICQRPFARQDKLKTHLERHLYNSSKTSQNKSNMAIASYPPASMNQSTGGQVPIKVLLPAGKLNNHNNSITPNNQNPIQSTASSNNSLRFGVPNSNGLSISYSLGDHNSISQPLSINEGLTVTPAHVPNSTNDKMLYGSKKTANINKELTIKPPSKPSSLLSYY